MEYRWKELLTLTHTYSGVSGWCRLEIAHVTVASILGQGDYATADDLLRLGDAEFACAPCTASGRELVRSSERAQDAFCMRPSKCYTFSPCVPF